MAPLGSIFGERHTRVASLLRTIVNEAVLAYIQVTRTGAAAPIVFASCGNIVLKRIHARKRTFAEAHDFLENFAFVRRKGLELAVTVVNDADCRSESQF